jgi:hypothetical protein
MDDIDKRRLSMTSIVALRALHILPRHNGISGQLLSSRTCDMIECGKIVFTISDITYFSGTFAKYGWYVSRMNDYRFRSWIHSNFCI